MAVNFGMVPPLPGLNCRQCRGSLYGKSFGHQVVTPEGMIDPHLFHATCVTPSLFRRERCPTCDLKVGNVLPVSREMLGDPVYRKAMGVHATVFGNTPLMHMEDVGRIVRLADLERELRDRQVPERRIELLMRRSCMRGSFDDYQRAIEAANLLTLTDKNWVEIVTALDFFSERIGLNLEEVLRDVHERVGDKDLIAPCLRCIGYVGDMGALDRFIHQMRAPGWMETYFAFVETADRLSEDKFPGKTALLESSVEVASLQSGVPTTDEVINWCDELLRLSSRLSDLGAGLDLVRYRNYLLWRGNHPKTLLRRDDEGLREAFTA